MTYQPHEEDDMTTTARIQPAPVTGVFGLIVKRFSTKLLGEVPEPIGVYFHNRPVLKAFLSVSGKAQKWHACDENLKSLAHMAVAAQVGCSWCLDFGYFHAHNEGLDERKASQVPVWRTSEVFTPLERDVLEFAEAMTATPPTVTTTSSPGCWSSWARRPWSSSPPRSRSPTSTRARTSRWASSRRVSPPRAGSSWPGRTYPRGHDRPVRRAPQPALHGGLRDARLRG